MTLDTIILQACPNAPQTTKLSKKKKKPQNLTPTHITNQHQETNATR